MRADLFSRIIAHIHDAALDPLGWPVALQSLAEGIGAAGAAYIVRNSRSGSVEWASFLGPSAGFKSDYVAHFAPLDPFTELFARSEPGWLRLSESLPASVLRQDEWYNDFVLKCGVGDIIGAQVADTGSHTAVFGIHEAVGQKPLDPGHAGRLKEVLGSLGRAASVQLRLRELEWKSAIAARALDQLSTGVIITDRKARVIEMNGLAERVIRRGDGLVVQNGRLGALRVFEDARLGASIAAAAGDQAGEASSSRILIGRCNSSGNYMLTMTPLAVSFGFYSDPMALILVVDPDERLPEAGDLADYFGLSPAESRLGVQLMSGRQLADISTDSGVAISTLRTQLRSILKKVGVGRQADLLRVLASVPSLPNGRSEPG